MAGEERFYYLVGIFPEYFFVRMGLKKENYFCSGIFPSSSDCRDSSLKNGVS
jgi:hypothetical protein